MNTPARKSPVPALVMGLVAVPVVLVLAAWAAIAVLFPPAKVKAMVEAQLHGALSRDVRFAGASIGLWPPVTLRVEKPELAEPGGFANGTAFGAASLDLSLDVFALFSKRVKIERLTLEQPALHYVLHVDGTSNLDSLAAPAKPGAPPPAMDLDVRAFAIRDGRVLIDDVRAGRRTAFGIGTTTSLSAEQGGQRIATTGTTEISDLAFGPLSARTMLDLNRGLAKLVFHLEHAGKFDAKSNRLALERVALTLGHTQLALSGLVDDVGPHARYDLRAKGDGVDFGDVLAWAAVADAPAVKGLSGKGVLVFDVSVRGAAPAPGAAAAVPATRGWLTVKNASFRYAGAPADVQGLAFTANLAPDSVTVPDLVARVANQPVRARLFATRFRDPLVDLTVQGDLDLAAVGPLVAQPGQTFGGHANVDVRGRGRAKDPGAFALDGRAVLRGVSVASKDLPSRIEGVGGTVLFSGTSAEARALTARAGKSSFTLDAKIARPLALMAKPDSVPPAGVTFDFRSPYLDLAELLPTTPGAPFLPNASGGGKVSIDRLKQGKLDVTAVTADVALAPAALRSPSFSVQGYGGTIKGSANFDLRDTRKPVYAIKTTVENVQADQILAAWTPAKGLLRGTLTTNLDFSGAGQTPDDFKKSLTLVGLAALTEGQLGPGPTLDALSQFVKIPQLHEVKFKSLQLPMRIERGRLVTDPVNLSGTAGDWKLSGAVGFDGSLDYAVSVTLPPEAVAALNARSALAAGALSDDKGRMLLDLRVTGTAKSPRIAWDTGAMRDRLAGRASQALAEQRTKLEADAKAAAAKALADRLGLGASDSTKKAPPMNVQAAKDTLKKAAGDLFNSFFGGKKKPVPAPAPTPTDTTKH